MKEKGEIRKISVVTSFGGHTYKVGEEGIFGFRETHKYLTSEIKGYFYQGYDKDGSILVEINQLTPTVVVYEKH